MNDKRMTKSELLNELNAVRHQLALADSKDESAIRANLASDLGGEIGIGGHKTMSAPSRFAILGLTMITVCAISMSVMWIFFFNEDMQEHREQLQTIVQSQARLMEAIARYNSRVSDVFYDANPQYDAFAATMSQITDAHEKYEGYGITGEFTLARRDGDKIEFVMRHRFGSIEQPESVAFDSELAEPMRRALTGLAGTVIGLDYRGKTVLAAYEPVVGMNLGIVAKIDLAEIRAPFIKSGITAAVISFFVILVGTVQFFWISNPLIARLEAHSQDLQAELELRRRSEEALRVSEARFRTLFETSPDGVTIDQNGILVYANPAYQQMYGLENLQDQVGESYAPLIAPQDLDRVLAISAAREAGEAAPVTYEFIGMRTDGADFPVEVTAAPFEHDGQAATMAILRDITERKRAEEDLIESNDRFKRIASDAPIPIMIHAEDGEVLQISKAWTDLSGYSHDDIPSIADWTEQAYGERMENVRSIIDAVFKRNAIAHDGEFIITTKSKQNRLWDFSSGPLGRLPDGRRLMMSMASDITKRKQTEEALRESENRFKDLFDNAPVGYHIFDNNGIIVEINSVELELIGYSRDEIVGKKTWADLIIPEQIPQFEKHWKLMNEVGHVKDLEYTLKTKNNGLVTVLLNASSRFDQSGRLVDTRGSVLDISRRKQAEQVKEELYQQVVESQTKLEARSGQLVVAQETERRHLARELHDEIGQGMGVISLKLGQILDSNIDIELGRELTNIMEMVDSSLDNIRHMSRELRPSILDDLGLVPAIRWLFKRQAKMLEGFIPTINARGLKKRLDPNIEIVCYRIVQEALTNIMKHAQASRVTLILEEVGDRLHIKMEDNGIGFDVETAMKKATMGETMGLLSMEERASLLGGKLEITSQISEGTVIEGYMPLKSREAEGD